MTTPYLLVIPNGPDSKHRDWLKGKPGAIFDVGFLPYGNIDFTDVTLCGADNGLRSWGSMRSSEALRPWRALLETFDIRPDFFEPYTHIAFFADDIEADVTTANRMFQRADALGFDLCQCALTPDSHSPYAAVFAQSFSTYRLTNTVETMVICFSRRAFLQMIPAFRLQARGTGWGLETAMYFDLNAGPAGGLSRWGGKIGVLDCCVVAHRRPVGEGDAYIGVDPGEDSAPTLAAYGGQQVWVTQVGPPVPVPQVSLTMVVRNEAHRLGDMIRSHRPYVDDVVVVVQESTDCTLEIARLHADVVIERPSVGYCEAHREEACAYANHEWQLVLDADEMITPEFIRDLPELMNAPAAGYRLSRRNWIDGIVTWEGDSHHRLVRRSNVVFLDEIHTEPQSRVPWDQIPGLPYISIDHSKTDGEQLMDEMRCHELLSDGGALQNDPLRDRKLALNVRLNADK